MVSIQNSVKYGGIKRFVFNKILTNADILNGPKISYFHIWTIQGAHWRGQNADWIKRNIVEVSCIKKRLAETALKEATTSERSAVEDHGIKGDIDERYIIEEDIVNHEVLKLNIHYIEVCEDRVTAATESPYMVWSSDSPIAELFKICLIFCLCKVSDIWGIP